MEVQISNHRNIYREMKFCLFPKWPTCSVFIFIHAFIAMLDNYFATWKNKDLFDYHSKIHREHKKY